ncbi:response regulator transcription factor [Acidaminobacter sp. JC074]|uniref:response regulator transcription factor n=1 Tax=Acidaminobacter sp. JC074 TaxID=2530199 RepID=UPI001F0F84FC
MSKILIIEDDLAISDLLKMNLDMYGFDSKQAFDGLEGLEMMSQKPDLVVLDMMLPKKSGLEILPIIKKYGVPVIILTAKDSLKSKLQGFNLGADDYLTKPFEPLELISRINVVLRRNEQVIVENDFIFDDVSVCVTSRRVMKSGQIIDLTLKEFDLLHYFLINRGIALSREKLLDKIWDYDYSGNTRTVDMHVRNLRQKLDTDMIETVYKYGYRFDG